MVRKQQRKTRVMPVLGRKVVPSRQHFVSTARSLDTTLLHARCFLITRLILIWGVFKSRQNRCRNCGCLGHKFSNMYCWIGRTRCLVQWFNSYIGHSEILFGYSFCISRSSGQRCHLNGCMLAFYVDFFLNSVMSQLSHWECLIIVEFSLLLKEMVPACKVFHSVSE
jgi:hypothetical protein